MIPLLIGVGSAQVSAGYYAPPVDAPLQEAGVLICPPAPQEAAAANGLHRSLAESWSRCGYPTLMLTSLPAASGEPLGAEVLSQWLDALQRATAELEKLTGLNETIHFGSRLGGMLALHLQRDRAVKPQRRFVLHDPVLDLPEHLAELNTREVSRDRSGRDPLGRYLWRMHKKKPWVRHDQHRSVWNRFQQSPLGLHPGDSVQVVCSGVADDLEPFFARLRDAGVEPEVTLLSETVPWSERSVDAPLTQTAEVLRGMLPHL